MNTLRNGYKIYKFTITVPLIAAMVSAVRNDRGRLLPAVRSIELVVCKLHRKSSNVCLFIGYALISLRSENKSFRFLQVCVISSSELNIFSYPFHCTIIIHDVTRWSEHCSVMQLWRHQSIKYLRCRVFFPLSIGTKSLQIHLDLREL